MSINPLPAPAPSWFAPIAIGALATFLLHSLALVVPVFWLASCCCGATGVPVGFLPAFLAIRQDPDLSPGQGFAVSFIATGIGSLGVAFLVMVVLGWNMTPEDRDRIRQFFEREQQLSPQEIDQAVEITGQLIQFMPLIASGMVIVAGGLTGLVTGLLMRRRALPPQA